MFPKNFAEQTQNGFRCFRGKNISVTEFYSSPKKANSEVQNGKNVFVLPWNCSELNSERFSFREKTEFSENGNPMPGLTITSPYVHSRVDSNTFAMGNPMPESALSSSQGGFLIWPLFLQAKSLSTKFPKMFSITSLFYFIQDP